MKRFAAAGVPILLAVLLTACVMVPQSASPNSVPPPQAAEPALPIAAPETPLYGRELLGESDRGAYDSLLEVLNGAGNSADIPEMSATGLRALMNAIRVDNPLLSCWWDGEYDWSPNGGKVAVTFRYTLPDETIRAVQKQVENAAARLLEHITPSLPDYDKALLLHDRLVDYITYDRGAPRPNTLEGALLDGRATCAGYARAYQYLLGRLGIAAASVYGEAGEAHVWNLVRLEGDYVFCDLTWDDVPLADGTEYLSHEYFARDGTFFADTHTLDTTGKNPVLPEFTLDRNYFSQTGTMLFSAALPEAEEAFRAAIDQAAANGYPVLQIGLNEVMVADALEQGVLADGTLDAFVQDCAARRGMALRGRAFSARRASLIYVIDSIGSGSVP